MQVRLTLDLDSGNDAFASDPVQATLFCLRRVAALVENGHTGPAAIHDENGNAAGSFFFDVASGPVYLRTPALSPEDLRMLYNENKVRSLNDLEHSAYAGASEYARIYTNPVYLSKDDDTDTLVYEDYLFDAVSGQMVIEAYVDDLCYQSVGFGEWVLV